MNHASPAGAVRASRHSSMTWYACHLIKQPVIRRWSLRMIVNCCRRQAGAIITQQLLTSLCNAREGRCAVGWVPKILIGWATTGSFFSPQNLLIVVANAAVCGFSDDTLAADGTLLLASVIIVTYLFYYLSSLIVLRQRRSVRSIRLSVPCPVAQ